MPEARLYSTSPFSIFSSRDEIRTSLRSSFRPIWTVSSPGISRGVRPTSSSPAYRSFKLTRTSWTSMAVRKSLWMSSMPSRSVRPLHDSGIPDGPKRITTRPPRGDPTPTIILERLILIVLRDGLVDCRRERSPASENGAARSAPKRLNRAPLLTRIARPVFMAKTPKTNPHLQRVVRELREVSRKAEAPIWRDVAERLERSRKNWSEVNLSRLSRYAAKGEQIVVPGVVL